MTDRLGHYSFDQQHGLSGTGNYTVSLVVPANFQEVKDPGTVLISRGGLNVKGADFVLKRPTGTQIGMGPCLDAGLDSGVLNNVIGYLQGGKKTQG